MPDDVIIPPDPPPDAPAPDVPLSKIAEGIEEALHATVAPQEQGTACPVCGSLIPTYRCATCGHQLHDDP